MRRGLAAAILGFSLWIGSMAWSAYIATHTVLDPDRSEKVADALLDNESVRDQISRNIATAVAATVPNGVGVSSDDVAAASDAALDSPAVEAMVYDALVDSHQALLGEGEAPDSIESGEFGAAAREELIRDRPELEGVVPQAPTANIPLPTDNIPNLGPVRDALNTAVPVLAGVAAVGALLALVITSNRPAVIRRAGFWAIGLSLIVLGFAYGIPLLADRFMADSSEIVNALIDALAASMRVPALVLAGAGLGGVLLSLIWRPAAEAFTSAPQPAPARASAPLPASGARAGERARRRQQLGAPGQSSGRPGPRRDLPQPAHRPTPVASSPAAASGRPTTPPYGNPSPPSPAPTQVTPATSVASSSGNSPAPEPKPARENARWVKGVGWVHDGTGPIPESARFVPGVGYVLED